MMCLGVKRFNHRHRPLSAILIKGEDMYADSLNETIDAFLSKNMSPKRFIDAVLPFGFNPYDGRQAPLSVRVLSDLDQYTTRRIFKKYAVDDYDSLYDYSYKSLSRDISLFRNGTLNLEQFQAFVWRSDSMIQFFDKLLMLRKRAILSGEAQAESSRKRLIAR